MPKVIATAKVENRTEWENRFRTHADLFKEYTATAVEFSTTDDNDCVICFEIENLQTYLEQMKSPDTKAAMEHDGVKRETVKVFVLDKKIDL